MDNQSEAGGGRLGACSWSLRPEDPVTLIELLDRVRLDTIQLALMPAITEPRAWSDCFELLQSRGIRIASGMLSMEAEDYTSLDSIRQTGGVRPDEHWQANLDRALRVSDIAAENDVPLVTFHAGFIPHEADDPERTKMLDRIAMFADIFQERGVRLGLETGQETAETLVQVLDQLSHPTLGVNFDPANMILYGMGDPIQALRMLQPRLFQVHIKDAVASDVPGQWGTEVPVGEGDVDFPSFFEVLRDSSGPVDMMIEREAGKDRVEDIITARKLCEGLLKREQQ